MYDHDNTPGGWESRGANFQGVWWVRRVIFPEGPRALSEGNLPISHL